MRCQQLLATRISVKRKWITVKIWCRVNGELWVYGEPCHDMQINSFHILGECDSDRYRKVLLSRMIRSKGVVAYSSVDKRCAFALWYWWSSKISEKCTIHPIFYVKFLFYKTVENKNFSKLLPMSAGYVTYSISVREGILLRGRKKFALKITICPKNKQFALKITS